MYSVLKSLTFCACFGLCSVVAFGQGTSCAADGDNAKGSPVACVTGEGVEIKAAPTSAPQGSEVLPLTPEQRPATQPTVIFENGKLTIIANNATLGDILTIVGQKTGAVIDVPGEASERVVSQLGPGLPRDVVASLLNGSHFNYVLLGSEADVNAVSRVVLTAKSDHPGTATNSFGGPAVATNTVIRPTIQPRTALQQAIVQPYQEMLQQQAAQQIQTPDFQQPPMPSTSEAPIASNPAVTGEGGTPGTGAAQSGPTGTETATIDQPASSDGSQKEHTPQQMLQNLYETRRQMMQQVQDQQKAAQPQQ